MSDKCFVCTTLNFDFDECVFSESVTDDWQCETHLEHKGVRSKLPIAVHECLKT